MNITNGPIHVIRNRKDCYVKHIKEIQRELGVQSIKRDEKYQI